MGSWGREYSRQQAGPRDMADCGRTGQAVRHLAEPMAPHLSIDKPGGMAGEGKRLNKPGLQLGEIKPQTSD